MWFDETNTMMVGVKCRFRFTLQMFVESRKKHFYQVAAPSTTTTIPIESHCLPASLCLIYVVVPHILAVKNPSHVQLRSLKP